MHGVVPEDVKLETLSTSRALQGSFSASSEVANVRKVITAPGGLQNRRC